MGETKRRAAILSAASRLFAEKGYVDTTTSEIACAAGVAEGTLYHHFDSKDGIFLTIFDEMTDGYLAGAEAAVRAGRTGAETLSALVRFHFDYVERHAARFLVIMRDFPAHLAAASAGRAAAARSRLGRLTDLLTETLARGTADGTLRLAFPARDTAEMIRATLYGTTRHRMIGIIDTPLPRLARVIEAFCRQALRPPAGEGGKQREGGRK
ncbi:MAG: TetR/AcrR family transcriptional regulator [Gemmatimonadota bacterium]